MYTEIQLRGLNIKSSHDTNKNKNKKLNENHLNLWYGALIFPVHKLIYDIWATTYQFSNNG